ncbi:acyltransferase family protein [Hyphomicrobium sp. 99]|uniref:acyltransferase family protein n=1 Tax=Hyphomicrobium sp. 99 TaxID=1163419 RepID=UPI0005F7A908|nr:acyltransferase family protein [Hyphomicrobium sp. 99]
MSDFASHKGVAYRSDLDGLRGIAVAAVVAYHFGFPYASGGFVGVDIFFVLSGFLITSIIAAELEAGTFSIANFYDRRVRRIVPALVFVCACTTALALFLLFPRELIRFASSLIATALSASNFWCLFHSGYFDPSAERQPLFHTWSLGVEEQFYIVFPLLLMAAFKWRRNRLGLIIWGLFAVSLLLSVLMLERNPKSTFFLLHTRAWELLTGSIIALGLIPRPASRLERDAAGALGLLAIAIAVFSFTSKTPFPGLAALLPCAGAALVIWGGQGGKENTPARFLTARPLVFLGLISYSLYLWHWPLIVFANLFSIEPLTGFQKTAVAGTSIALAALTWRFIELPFRRRGVGGFTRPAILWSGGLSLGSLAAVSLILISLHGVPSRFPQQVLDLAGAESDSSPFREKCHFGGALKRTYDDTCVLGGNVDPKIIVYSDSHGAEFSAALGSLAKERNESVRQITASACPPAANYSLDHGTRCGDYNAAMLARLISIPPSTILLAANSMSWSMFQPDQYWKGLQTTLAELHHAGHRLIVLGAVPPLPNHKPAHQALSRWAWLGNDPVNFTFAPDAERLRDVNEKLKDLAAEVNATFVPVSAAFCKDGRCSAYLEEAVLYFDDNHLSLRGAGILAKKLLVPLLWPEASASIFAGTQSPP